MGNFFGPFGSQNTSGAAAIGRLGPRLAYASPAGGAVAAAPAGFLTTTGRLVVSTVAGDATWASLTQGGDGQLLEVINAGPNNLTLPASVFIGFGDLFIPPDGRALIYYDSTDVSWERTSP